MLIPGKESETIYFHSTTRFIHDDSGRRGKSVMDSWVSDVGESRGSLRVGFSIRGPNSGHIDATVLYHPGAEREFHVLHTIAFRTLGDSLGRS